MLSTYGIELDRESVNRKFGSLHQFAGIEEYEYRRGKAKNSTVLEVRNGTGLRFQVLPDRGLDIGQAEFKGRPFSWISRNGPVGPTLLDLSPLGFLRSFTGGLLTTCGLTQVGLSEQGSEGELLPFHGRIAHTPADRYVVEERWEERELVFHIRGEVRESRVYAENLVLERNIATSFGRNEIRLLDRIRNEGNRSQPLMFFYHINFGFPLVSENSKYYTAATRVWALNESAENGDGDHQGMTREQDLYPFQCFVHEMQSRKFGTQALILNEKLNFGVYLEYSPEELPFFNQWKVMEMQDYVVAFEPGNCMPEGQTEARKKERLAMIEPGQIVEVKSVLGVEDDRKELEEIVKLIQEQE